MLIQDTHELKRHLKTWFFPQNNFMVVPELGASWGVAALLKYALWDDLSADDADERRLIRRVYCRLRHIIRCPFGTFFHWIPACAGMTVRGRNDERVASCLVLACPGQGQSALFLCIVRPDPVAPPTPSLKLTKVVAILSQNAIEVFDKAAHRH